MTDRNRPNVRPSHDRQIREGDDAQRLQTGRTAVTRAPMTMNGVDFTDLMTTAEVAQRFRVSPKSVSRWAADGQLASIRTLGNHRRYSRAQVEALLRGDRPAGDVPPP